jgi:tRNA pseudouridine38-40 synthase
MPNYCLTVQYDGTDYAGFQIQPGQPTIQGELERALFTLAKEPIRVMGAGRSDAGVHSEGQVVSFRTAALSVPIERLSLAVNTLLPPDIRVIESRFVPDDFHARYSALHKTYRYQIYHGPYPNVFWRRYALWERDPLDWDSIRECTHLYIGTHDFAAFQASGSSVKTTIRTMMNVTVDSQSEIKSIRFTADGFLYNMVRNLVGTLLDVGRGKLEIGAVKEIMESRDRRQAGATAAPYGLFLERVDYP